MDRKNWSQFTHYFRRAWKPGEHVTIIGPTGSGKSFLALQLMALREYYALLLTKGNDRTLDSFIKEHDITVIKDWAKLDGFTKRVALWPRFNGVASFATQQTVFRDAINGTHKYPGIYKEGEWSLLIDEVMYWKEELHLEPELRMLWTQGRSNNLSLVAGTQRPRDVPMLMLNQWSHLFVFQTSDRYEIQRLADIGGNISTIIKTVVPSLERHTFLYVNRLSNYACISRVEKGK